MKDNPDKIFVERILNKISPHLKPVDYLMDILGLSRDSVYRRLKGEKSFTFHELLKLSADLGVSIDEISATVYAVDSPELVSGQGESGDKGIIDAFKHLYNLVANHIDRQNTELIATINDILPTTAFSEELIFRFLYYKWMHQTRKIPMDFPFSNIVVPNELISYCNRYQEMVMAAKNMTLIIDSGIIRNLIADIQYFYRRRLITDEELALMKKVTISFLKTEIGILQKAPVDDGRRYNCYLSTLFVGSNTMYSFYDDVEESNFWVYSVYPVTTTDPGQCRLHRKWLDSLKRYSTLISAANEIALAKYMSDQNELIMDMDKITY